MRIQAHVSASSVCLLVLLYSTSSAAVCPSSTDMGVISPLPGADISLTSEFRFVHPIQSGEIFTLEAAGVPTVTLVRDPISPYVLSPAETLTENINYSLYSTFEGCLEECRQRLSGHLAIESERPEVPAPIIEYAGFGETSGLNSCETNFDEPVSIQEEMADQHVEVRLIPPNNPSDYRIVVSLFWTDQQLGIERILRHAPPVGVLESDYSNEDIFGVIFRVSEENRLTDARVVIHYVDNAGQIGPEVTRVLAPSVFPLGCSHKGPAEPPSATFLLAVSLLLWGMSRVLSRPGSQVQLRNPLHRSK